MHLRTLPTPSALLGDAFQRARARFGTLLALALLPLLSLGLLAPLLAEVYVAQHVGFQGDLAAFVSPSSAALAILGLVVSAAVSFATMAAMFTVLHDPADSGPRLAFQRGVRRWGAVLLTEVVVVGTLLLAAVPSIAFVALAGRVLDLPTVTDVWIRAVVFATTLVLFVPVLIVASWYVFAPIPAALGQAWGVAALRRSHRLVAGATGRVFGLLVFWVFLEVSLSFILAALFPGLELFQMLVFYLTVTILGVAYLFSVYRALEAH